MRRWWMPVVLAVPGLLFCRDGFAHSRFDALLSGVICIGIAALVAWRIHQSGLWCVLCGKWRKEVRWLVAGHHGAVCDDCIGTSIGVLESAPASRADLSLVRSAFRALLQAPVRRLSKADSTTLARVSLILDGDDVAQTRRLVGTMLQFDNPEMALTLSDLIPTDQRTARDLVTRSAIFFELRRYADGVASLAALDPGALEPELRAFVLNNRAACTVAEGDLDPERLQACRALAEEARGVFAELLSRATATEKARRAQSLASTLSTLAHCAFAEARLDEALDLLEQAEQLAPTAWDRLLKARVHAAKRNPLTARTAARQAMDLSHPESLDYAEAVAMFEGTAASAELPPTR